MAISIEKNEQGWRVISNVPIWILICNNVNWFYYFEHYKGTVDIGYEDTPLVFNDEDEVKQYIIENNLTEVNNIEEFYQLD